MIGNVNGIVDSVFAAENLRSRQNTVNTKNGNSFSDYLNYALLNAQSGALFGSGNGISSGYAYMNPLSGSIWQTFALKALADGLQKTNPSPAQPAADGQRHENKNESVQTAQQKPDWAKIRVIRYYQSPAEKTPVSRGISV